MFQSRSTSISFLASAFTIFELTYHGVVRSVRKSHGNALSLYVQDPEGNQCEIYCHTPWYVSQPVGKPLDLTLSEEEILAQVEAECRDNPTFMPRQQWIENMQQQMQSA